MDANTNATYAALQDEFGSQTVHARMMDFLIDFVADDMLKLAVEWARLDLTGGPTAAEPCPHLNIAYSPTRVWCETCDRILDPDDTSKVLDR